MAQYIIPATFADDTWFKIGLSPTITIRERDPINLVYVNLISETMQDMGLWDYVYIFSTYDKTKLYHYKIDGWDDTLNNRYFSGNNELDFYSNKEDWGSMFRGYANSMDTNITKSVVKAISSQLKELKTKPIDLSEIISKLDDINNKEIKIEVPDNSEIVDLIKSLDNKESYKEMIKLFKENKSKEIIKIQKDKNIEDDKQSKILEIMKENKSFTKNILERVEKDSIIINSLRKNIEDDEDFKELVKQKEEDKEEIMQLILENDEDFISLLSEWVYDN